MKKHLQGYIYVLITIMGLFLYIVIPNPIAKVFFMLLSIGTLIYSVVIGTIHLMEKAGTKIETIIKKNKRRKK